MKHAFAAVAVLMLAGVATGQSVRDRQDEYQRAERQLQKSRSEVDRLVDMRFRHDLGLPTEEDPTMPRSGPMSTAQKERMVRDLREQDSQTASLLSRFNKLKGMVDSLREDAAARAATEADGQFVVVPSAGAMQNTSGPQTPVEAIDTQRGSGPGTDRGAGRDSGNVRAADTPANGRELGPLPAGTANSVRLGRVRGQIRGSTDHLRVAQALFKAGQALMDTAALSREEGNGAVAVELDNRGKDRLGRALAELQPLLAEKEPSYAALFCQGRCLELQFDHSVRYEGLSLRTSTKLFQQREQEVREPFLAISARDVKKTGERGELEVLGSWGMAANAAVEHFRWMNQYGSYRPITPIENITWPGEKDQ